MRHELRGRSLPPTTKLSRTLSLLSWKLLHRRSHYPVNAFTRASPLLLAECWAPLLLPHCRADAPCLPAAGGACCCSPGSDRRSSTICYTTRTLHHCRHQHRHNAHVLLHLLPILSLHCSSTTCVLCMPLHPSSASRVPAGKQTSSPRQPDLHAPA